MLKTLKKLVEDDCQLCGEVIEGEAVEAQVKVPGYTGTHQKSFCCKQHLGEWKEFVEEWENENHKIPRSSKSCPTCMG